MQRKWGAKAKSRMIIWEPHRFILKTTWNWFLCSGLSSHGSSPVHPSHPFPAASHGQREVVETYSNIKGTNVWILIWWVIYGNITFEYIWLFTTFPVWHSCLKIYPPGPSQDGTSGWSLKRSVARMKTMGWPGNKAIRIFNTGTTTVTTHLAWQMPIVFQVIE